MQRGTGMDLADALAIIVDSVKPGDTVAMDRVADALVALEQGHRCHARAIIVGFARRRRWAIDAAWAADDTCVERG